MQQEPIVSIIYSLFFQPLPLRSIISGFNLIRILIDLMLKLNKRNRLTPVINQILSQSKNKLSLIRNQVRKSGLCDSKNSNHCLCTWIWRSKKRTKVESKKSGKLRKCGFISLKPFWEPSKGSKMVGISTSTTFQKWSSSYLASCQWLRRFWAIKISLDLRRKVWISKLQLRFLVKLINLRGFKSLMIKLAKTNTSFIGRWSGSYAKTSSRIQSTFSTIKSLKLRLIQCLRDRTWLNFLSFKKKLRRIWEHPKRCKMRGFTGRRWSKK